MSQWGWDRGNKRLEKLGGTKKKQLEGHFAPNYVNWVKVSTE